MSATRLLNRIVPISLIGFIFGLSLNLVIAQTPATPEEIYLLQNNQLKKLDAVTLNQEIIITEIMPPNTRSMMSPIAEQIDRRSLAADIDSQAKYVYLIEGWGRSTNRGILNLPTGAELIQLDLATGTRRVIFDRTTVFNFVLSPDESRMIVFFYAAEYLYSTQRACILDLQTLECLTLAYDYVGGTGFWLNNDSFIIGTNDINPLRRIDANTGASITLEFPAEWQVYWGTVIPMTNKLVVTGQPYQDSLSKPIGFLTYDLDSGQTQVLSYSAPNINDYLLVSNLQISPDGQFMLYGGRKSSLVEYNTGRLIREFNWVITADWLDNHTLLIQGSQDGTQLEIFQFDAISGESKTLLSGDAAAGVLLVP